MTTPYKVTGETDTHFRVHDGRGEFRVAKAGLSGDILERIRGFADGGLVGDPAPLPLGGVGVPPSGGVVDVRTGRVSAADPVAEYRAAMAQAAAEDARKQEEAAASLNAMLAQRAAQPAPGEAPAPALAPVPSHGPEPVLTAPPEPVPSHVEPPPAPPAAEPAPSAAATPAPAPAAPAAPRAPSGPSTQSEVAAGRNAQAEGIRLAAEAAAEEGRRQEAVYADLAQKREAATADYQDRLAKLQAQGDALHEEVRNGKVQPGRLYANMGTGGRVTAAIGMILGGIGAGLTRGPNYAVEIIDRAIQRDIDSQKANLGKTESLLAQNLQRTHSEQAAYQLTKADLLDAAAGQLQRAAAQTAGDKARAAAEQQIGALRAEAAKERQAVTAQGLDIALRGMQIETQRQLAPLQIAGARGELAKQQAQAEVLRRVTAGLGDTLPPGALNYLPDDMQARIVTLPNNEPGQRGKAIMMPTKEEAAKVRDQIAGMVEVTGAVADMRLQREEKGRAWLPGTAEAATSEAQRTKMIAGLRTALVGPGAVSEGEWKILKSMVPEPGEIFTSDAAFEARMNEIEQKVQDAVRASLYRAGPQGARYRVK